MKSGFLNDQKKSPENKASETNVSKVSSAFDYDPTTTGGSQEMDKNDAAKASPSPTNSSLPPTSRMSTHNSRAVGFGRNYFYSLGGLSPSSSSVQDGDDDNDHTMTMYQWDYPPWSKAATAATSETPPSSTKRRPFIQLRSSKKQQPAQKPPETEEEGSSSLTEEDDEHVQQQQQALNERSAAFATSESDPDGAIIQAIATSQSTVFLTQAGKVYQVGTLHGRVYPHPTSVDIPLPLPCVELAAGRHFVLGRMEGGLAVCSWGAGHFGQLGIGNGGSSSSNNQPITFTSKPILMERLLPRAIGSTIAQVAAGDWHGLALTESGMVWAWGSNRSQQCGRRQKHSSPDETPTLVVPAPVQLDVEIGQIAAGRSHSLALTKVTQQVYSWGSSLHGQCGNAVRRSPQSPRLVEGMRDLTIGKIAAAGNHSLALSVGGRLFSWGQQTEGQLGLGTAYLAQPKPRLVSEIDFVAIIAGQEWRAQQQKAANDTSNGESSTQDSFESPLKNIPRITEIYAGPSYSVAVSSSVHAYCFGSNDASQLGIPTSDELPFRDNTFPTAALASANNRYMAGNEGKDKDSSSASRDLHIQTFDSRHNVLLPTRVDRLVDSISVRTVACGPNHLWFIGQGVHKRNSEAPVGYTLHEVQSGVVPVEDRPDPPGHENESGANSRSHETTAKSETDLPPPSAEGNGDKTNLSPMQRSRQAMQRFSKTIRRRLGGSTNTPGDTLIHSASMGSESLTEPEGSGNLPTSPALFRKKKAAMSTRTESL